MTQPTPQQLINAHRAEEIQILARMMRRSKEDAADENRLHQLSGIIAGIEATIPKNADTETPPPNQDGNEDETRPG